MSHIVIEHSSNLRRQLNLPKFVEAIHEAALATGMFPMRGMRTRSFESEALTVGHRDHTFVHMCIRVGQGRDLASSRQVCERILAAACEQLREVHARAPLGISVEMQERDPDANLSNVREYVTARQAQKR